MLNDLFTKALGLLDPWRVDDVDFQTSQGNITFRLRFDGKRAACPVCGLIEQPIHDRLERRWQHLNFFQYRAYLIAGLPRVACQCGKTTQLEVPWANPRSGFTLLFEAYALALAQQLPVSEVAKMLGTNPQPLWKRLVEMVLRAYDQESFANLRHLTIDETAIRRGHDYVTVIADRVARKVVFVTEGKDALTMGDFASELLSHGAKPAQVESISMDFSAAFQLGAKQNFPDAKVHLDPFHLVALASEAVDAVRREEVKAEPTLRKQRYSLLKSESGWTAKQAAFMAEFKDSHLKSARAWRIKEMVRDLVRMKADETTTRDGLQSIVNHAQRSRLAPVIRFGQTVRKHFEGIVSAIANRRSNGFAEGLNSLIQTARQRARGFKTAQNFIAIIYLIAAKLQNLPKNPMAQAA